MTDVLPDREQLTQPIAHRRYTPAVYDCNATAIIRTDETLILAAPNFDPDTSGEIVPLMHLMQTAYGTAPTVPPPLPPNPPPAESLMKPGRTVEYFQDGPRGHVGAHRKPWPRWADQLIGAGWATVAWSVLGLAVLAVIR